MEEWGGGRGISRKYFLSKILKDDLGLPRAEHSSKGNSMGRSMGTQSNLVGKQVSASLVPGLLDGCLGWWQVVGPKTYSHPLGKMP